MGAEISKNSEPSNVNTVTSICHQCGGVFSIEADVASRTYGELKMNCERCAASIIEEKVSAAKYLRKCGTCQGLFSVSRGVADFPPGFVVNCQRCSDTRRTLVSSGTYLEVALQKGDEKLYIFYPRNMHAEMRRYMTLCNHQGYTMITAPDEREQM